jgi:hypothetical protein
MKLSKAALVIVAVLVVLLGVRIALSIANRPSDQAQIEQALADSIKASKEGRPGGVMDKLSGRLKVNEMDASSNRSQIANYIKQNHPDVVVQNKKAVVSGDEAQIVSPVDIELSFLGQTRTLHLEEVTMIFRKETDYEYLVIPTDKWKLAEVRVPDSALSEFMQSPR